MKYVREQSRSPICMTCGRLGHAKHLQHASKSSIPGLVTRTSMGAMDGKREARVASAAAFVRALMIYQALRTCLLWLVSTGILLSHIR